MIISGGSIKDSFALSFLQQKKPEYVIAADKGMEFCYRNGICPDVIVGDFDSADGEVLSYFRGQKDVEIITLNPIKDDTDTEFAIRHAMEKGASTITVLGGTGSRIDHVLGNIELLGIGLASGIPIILQDSCNRVRMIDRGIAIDKAKQFGVYVSLIPYTAQVEHLYLRGFKYPLSDYCMTGFNSLGVSNEITDERGEISFEKGILLVIESRDGESA